MAFSHLDGVFFRAFVADLERNFVDVSIVVRAAKCTPLSTVKLSEISVLCYLSPTTMRTKVNAPKVRHFPFNDMPPNASHAPEVAPFFMPYHDFLTPTITSFFRQAFFSPLLKTPDKKTAAIKGLSLMNLGS